MSPRSDHHNGTPSHPWRHERLWRDHHPKHHIANKADLQDDLFAVDTALIAATISIAQGISAALSKGFPVGAIETGLVAAADAVQIAAIRAQGGGSTQNITFASVIQVELTSHNGADADALGSEFGQAVLAQLEPAFRGLLMNELRSGGLLNRGDAV